MTLLAVVIATLSLVLAGLMAYRVRALEQGMHQSQRAIVQRVARINNAARRMDDRLTYYEHRPDGLKNLRHGYDKRLAQLAQKRAGAEASDAAPEGTAQAERLVG